MLSWEIQDLLQKHSQGKNRVRNISSYFRTAATILFTLFSNMQYYYSFYIFFLQLNYLKIFLMTLWKKSVHRGLLKWLRWKIFKLLKALLLHHLVLRFNFSILSATIIWFIWMKVALYFLVFWLRIPVTTLTLNKPMH